MDLDGLCFVKRDGRLVPADFHADEWVAGLREGQEVILTGRKARSPAHHRWFFALLRMVKDNSSSWPDEEALLDALKLDAGHVAVRRRLDGTVYLVPKSISFAAMDQLRFRKFVDRCLHSLGQMLGVSPETLMRETDRSQGGYYQRTFKGRVGTDGYYDAETDG